MPQAFFISPDGEIVPVPVNHIQRVITSPGLFNLTKEEIKAVYKKFNEPLGLEGKARKEILARLIEAGWIRIRYKGKYDKLTFQLSVLDDKKIDFLIRFANAALRDELELNVNKYTDTEIISLTPKVLKESSLGELAEGTKIRE